MRQYLLNMLLSKLTSSSLHFWNFEIPTWCGEKCISHNFLGHFSKANSGHSSALCEKSLFTTLSNHICQMAAGSYNFFIFGYPIMLHLYEQLVLFLWQTAGWYRLMPEVRQTTPLLIRTLSNWQIFSSDWEIFFLTWIIPRDLNDLNKPSYCL